MDIKKGDFVFFIVVKNEKFPFYFLSVSACFFSLDFA